MIVVTGKIKTKEERMTMIEALSEYNIICNNLIAINIHQLSFRPRNLFIYLNSFLKNSTNDTYPCGMDTVKGGMRSPKHENNHKFSFAN